MGSDRTPSPEAMRAANRILDKIETWCGARFTSDELAAFIDAEFRQLRESREMLVRACRLARDELTHATWAKGADQRGLKYAIEKIDATLRSAKAGDA